MIEIHFLMANDAQPNFDAVLNIGQWNSLAVPTSDPVGGRNHVVLETFDSTQLFVRDSLFNPIVVMTEEDPGPVFIELMVRNQGGDQLSIEVPGSDILKLKSGESATVSYQRSTALVQKP